MFLSLCRHTNTQTQTAMKKREMTSSMSSLVRIWKIRHSGPGCSFVWVLRVTYFPVKHPCLYNKYYVYEIIQVHSKWHLYGWDNYAPHGRHFFVALTSSLSFDLFWALSKSGLNLLIFRKVMIRKQVCKSIKCWLQLVWLSCQWVGWNEVTSRF